ncbi:serine hydrolase [Vagococcus xieshaowenii]
MWTGTIVAVILLGELGVHATERLDAKVSDYMTAYKNKDKPDPKVLAQQKKEKERQDKEQKQKDLSNQLINLWKEYAKDKSPVIDIAVYDMQSNQEFQYTNQHEQPLIPTASVIKVSVLTALLHKHQEEQTELSELEIKSAENMIKSSDNNATTYLIDNYLDKATSIQALFDTLEMNDSTYNYHWGQTTTTAKDQIKLLKNVFMPSDYLIDSEREYIQKLMSEVDIDQAWGVGAGSSHVALKNGWLTDTNDCVINSIGQVMNGDKKYLIAVFTNHDQTMAEGKQIIEQLTKITSDILFQQ